MYRVLKLNESETPEAMQKIADKQMPEGGYRYIATHAIGPGTLPDGVEVFKTEDIEGGKIAMYISRPLTSEELNKYDIKPEWVQECDKTIKEDEEDGELPLPDEVPEEDIDNVKPEEDIEDKVADEIPDEEYMVDPILNELRDVLVDLDWNLFMVGNDDIGPVYIIGRLNEDGEEEMLVPDGDTFKFIPLPDLLDEILRYETVYGKPDEEKSDEAGEDMEVAPEDNLAKGVPHDEIMEFLMNKLVEINPEAAKDLDKEEEPVEEPTEPEVPEDNEEGDEE